MRRQLLALALLAMPLAACGGHSDASPATTAAAAQTGATAQPNSSAAADGSDAATTAPTTALPDPGAPPALQFAAPLVGGGSIDFTQYAGRTLVLWFWAPT
ncbi:MAG: hypothetical protein WCC60_24030 [Ilumatobacteraceae bacterium]